MSISNVTAYIVAVTTVSEMNAHEHWRVRQKRAKAQRLAARLATASARNLAALRLPLRITLTRCSPRFLDSDNLVASQKHVRDGITDALGLDDGDPRLNWLYEQRPGKAARTYVEIRGA